MKKGSIAPSATDVAERVENTRKKKEKKEDKNLEEKVKFCRPGTIENSCQRHTCSPYAFAFAR